MREYDNRDEAVKAGEDPDKLVTIGYRTEEERVAVETAMMRGNRKQRRMLRFRPHLLVNPRAQVGAEVPDLTPAERQRRAKARVTAKKSRKANGKNR